MTSFLPSGVGDDLGSFNWATGMKPWMTADTTLGGLKFVTLQLGHGDEAVDDEESRVVDHQECKRFNWATGMKPWMTPASPARDGGQVRFNWATGMKPWMTPARTAPLSLRFMLQLGHGDEAVDDQPVDRQGKIGAIGLQLGHGDEAVDDDHSRAERNRPIVASIGPRG